MDSVGFEDAPDTILKGLAQLDWAQSLGITHLSKFIQEFSTDYSDTSMSLKSERFNELLALGYFQGSKINYHDDGEKELGPTVATLSLGSPAVMRFRPKRRTKLGQAGSGKTGDKPAVVSFILNHGDIVIMHGTDIHREYEVSLCFLIRSNYSRHVNGRTARRYPKRQAPFCSDRTLCPSRNDRKP